MFQYILACLLLLSFSSKAFAPSDEEALLNAIALRPDDDLPRLVYADWLEDTGGEQNTTRAQFIRASIENHPLATEIFSKWSQTWINQNREGYLQDWPDVTNFKVWKRGFPDEASLSLGILPEGFGSVALQMNSVFHERSTVTKIALSWSSTLDRARFTRRFGTEQEMNQLLDERDSLLTGLINRTAFLRLTELTVLPNSDFEGLNQIFSNRIHPNLKILRLSAPHALEELDRSLPIQNLTLLSTKLRELRHIEFAIGLATPDPTIVELTRAEELLPFVRLMADRGTSVHLNVGGRARPGFRHMNLTQQFGLVVKDIKTEPQEPTRTTVAPCERVSLLQRLTSYLKSKK